LPQAAFALAGGVLAFAVPGSPARGEVLLVGNKGENSLSLIDFASGRECVRLPTAPAPHEIAVSPDGRHAAVVGYGAASVDLFDLRQQRLIRRMDLGDNQGPHGIVWLRRNRIVLVADRANTLVSLDPRYGTYRSVPTGQRGSHMVAVSRDGKLAWVSNILSGTVSLFDLRKMVKLRDLAVGGNPEGLALSRDGRQLWVGDNSGPRVKVVDSATGKLVTALESDSVALRLAASPHGTSMVASGFMTGSLTIYDTRQQRRLRSIVVSGQRQAMQVTLLWTRHPSRILVAETGRNQIAEVDVPEGRVLRRIAAGRNGDGLALAPGTCRPAT
jgi:DNA-binding beta-propeller fold protein YncE